MGQETPITKKSPIDKVWDIARSNLNLAEEQRQSDAERVKRETVRIRSKIEKSGIGDRAVYNDTRPASAR